MTAQRQGILKQTLLFLALVIMATVQARKSYVIKEMIE